MKCIYPGRTRIKLQESAIRIHRLYVGQYIYIYIYIYTESSYTYMYMHILTKAIYGLTYSLTSTIVFEPLV